MWFTAVYADSKELSLFQSAPIALFSVMCVRSGQIVEHMVLVPYGVLLPKHCLVAMACWQRGCAVTCLLERAMM